MERSKVAPSELEQIEVLKKVFKNNKIKIKKYNYAIDESVQNFSSFDAYLQLSEDETKFIVTNKKPVNDPEYIYEADPQLIKKAQEKFKLEQIEGKSEKRSTIKDMSNKILGGEEAAVDQVFQDKYKGGAYDNDDGFENEEVLDY